MKQSLLNSFDCCRSFAVHALLFAAAFMISGHMYGQCDGGALSGGPFDFCVDGQADNVSGITLDGNTVSINNSWVITDSAGVILGLPPMPGVVDFDEAGAGVCFIYNVAYEDGLVGLESGLNVADLDGCFGLSNAVVVNRSQPLGGTLTGGPFEFCVDGVPDMVSGITLADNSADATNAWVITDDQGVILGLPPMPGVVDFDGAGAGTCFIYNVAYTDSLGGLAAGENIADFDGCFDISNSIAVVRNQPLGGVIAGGPFEFCVDGAPDMVAGITLEGDEGSNSQWVVTDAVGNILGLPPVPEAPDFDGAGTGVCFIYHLSYEDGISGLMVDLNINELEGCYDLSNGISVVRTTDGAACDDACDAQAGTLTGGPFEFCVDGMADMVSGITLDGGQGDTTSWVITDADGFILGLPPMPGVVDFDGAGAGVCLIWSIAHAVDLSGLAPEANIFSDLQGCYSLSNPIRVERSEPLGGTLTGGPFEFCVDGLEDTVSGITLDSASGGNIAWVITDDQGNILGLPPVPSAVNFDDAGAGVCLIYNISYEDGLVGLAAGSNLSDLAGCFDLSNSISVTRSTPSGGVLTGGPFDFCVDGVADMVSDITLDSTSGSINSWVVTDIDGNILGLPPMPGVVDFDDAGVGICLIYNVSHEEGLVGLEAGSNIGDLAGCFGISNAVTVNRTSNEGGTLAGGPFEFCIDGIDDFVFDVSVVGNSGEQTTWVITETDGTILGAPESLEEVNFDGAGGGTCLIWSLSYTEGLEGLDIEGNLADLAGCFALSDSIVVLRDEPIGGELVGQLEYEFCVDDTPDFIGDLEVQGNSGENGTWLVVDGSTIEILGIPDSPQSFDFNGLGEGMCFLGWVSYSDGLTGLEVGSLGGELMGCLGASENAVQIDRVTSGDVCVTSTEDNVLEEVVSVFPNPASQYINLVLDASVREASWIMMDGIGQIVKRSKTQGVWSQATIDVSDVPVGIYVIQVTIDQETISKRVSVVK